MKYLSFSEARRIYDEEWAQAESEYGDQFKVPKAVRDRLCERNRARLCAATNPGWSSKEIVSYYAIDWRVAEEIFGVVDSVEKKAKRSDKYGSVFSWCAENVLAQVTPAQICEIGEISYPTALKLISDRPDLFRRLKRGLYEVRDPAADRVASKN